MGLSGSLLATGFLVTQLETTKVLPHLQLMVQFGQSPIGDRERGNKSAPFTLVYLPL